MSEEEEEYYESRREVSCLTVCVLQSHHLPCVDRVGRESRHEALKYNNALSLKLERSDVDVDKMNGYGTHIGLR